MKVGIDLPKTTSKTFPIMFSLLMAAFIGLFNETALNMAFTEIMQDYAIKATDVQWLTTGYLLTLGILLPVSGLLIQWLTTCLLYTSRCV